MAWDEDDLEYGHVIAELADRTWWHMHFGRSAWTYRCELLGRRTCILADIRRLGRGAVARSANFYLTLDGEGVGLSVEEAGMNYWWGRGKVRYEFPGCGPGESIENARDVRRIPVPADAGLAAEALHFQREIMPRIHVSPAFREATDELVARQRHRRMIRSGKLNRD